jgi:acetoin utilization deacetylase AcuC-like enzyme
MATGFYSHDLSAVYDQGQDSPEQPQRIVAIEEQMFVSGLHRVVVPMHSEPATFADALRAHDLEYLETLRAGAEEGGSVRISDDTRVNALSFDAAMKSAGAAIQAVRDVVAGRLTNAFVCVRPPGHHAGRSFGHGFCLINSVACAALAAIETMGLSRVAILDIDVHRADGTEDIVRNDSRIRLFNLFQASAFPFGVPPATSQSIVDSPLPDGADGRDVLGVIEGEWLPSLVEFAPELILVSAGFDAHRDEKQALLKLTEFDYSLITEDILRIAHVLCSDRLVSVLEGGYNLSSLARSAISHITTLARGLTASVASPAPEQPQQA